MAMMAAGRLAASGHPMAARMAEGIKGQLAAKRGQQVSQPAVSSTRMNSNINPYRRRSSMLGR